MGNRTVQLLCLIICLLNSFTLQAQLHRDSILQIGKEETQKGINFFYTNQIDSALYYLIKATNRFEEEKAWEEYVCNANSLAFIYVHIGQYGPTDQLITKAYEMASEYLKKDSPCLLHATSNMHQYFQLRGDFENVIKMLERALDIVISTNGSILELAKTYQNLGNGYVLSGDITSALIYYKKAIKIEQDSFPGSAKISDVYQNTARAFQLDNQIDSAIYYYEKAEKVLASIDYNHPLISNKIENVILLTELNSLKNNESKNAPRKINLNPNKLSDVHKVLFAQTEAKMLFAQKKYEDAVKAFMKTQDIADKFDGYNSRRQQARRYVQWAQAHANINQPLKALAIYQKGLNLLSPKDSLKNEFDNPEANELLDKPDALGLLKGKAATLYDMSNNSKGLIHLTAAYQTYVTATKLISEIRQDILSIQSKNSLAESSVPVFEGAIQCALELYVLTKDEKYKAEAFSLAEGNKAMLLLESINEQTARGFAGIPDTLLAKEKTLKSNLAFLKRTLLEKQNGAISASNISDQIFDKQQDLNLLVTNLEENYPRYFELKYKNEPIELAVAQKELAKSKQVILEYFFGLETIYLFAISSDKLNIYEIKNVAEIKTAIQNLRGSLNTNPALSVAQQSFNNFSAPAHFLYSQLLQPALNHIPNSVDNLIVIPDDLLNYLPFGVLLSSAPESSAPGYGLEQLDYLLEDYAINYQYSATLRHKSQQRTTKSFKHNFIGFAPNFKNANTIANRACVASDLYSLQCNGQEVNNISRLINGLSLEGSDATGEKFTSLARDYRIIHLATHACVDEEEANLNKIFLSDDYISNGDLYNIDLQAELAVLSACNTGSGILVKGEGVMSLARGFLNAGCASTVMSMWSVDDCATSDIMLDFYQGLTDGLPKDQALRATKLNYLKTASNSKLHPYYWAPFVQFGEVAPVEFNGGWSWVGLLGLGLVVIAGLWLLRSARKSGVF